MALTGGYGFGVLTGREGDGGYEPSDERLARGGIVRVSAEEAVGMSARDFGDAVRDMRGENERGRGKKRLSRTERERRKISGAAQVVMGLAAGAGAYRRSTRERLGLDE